MNGHAALPSTRRTTISQRRGPSTAKKHVPPENGASNENISKPASSDQPYHERKVKKLRLSRALTIPEGTSVFDACRKMAARRADAMLLTDANGLLSGIVTDKDITTRVVAEELRPDQTPVSKIMTRNPIFVNSDSLAIDALQKMIHGKFRHLPVVENGEVIALLDITKCLYDAIEKMEKAAEQGSAIAAAVEGVEKQWGNNFTAPYAFIETIRERMFRPSLSTIVTGSSSVSLVSPSDPVYVAAKRMSETRSTSVIVSSQNKIQGILTSKDILMRVVAQNLSPELTLVEKVMTLSPECASLETPILDALHMMHDRKFLHLPVTDKGGSVVACLDVLQITNAAISLVENGGGTAADDMANTMMQKFWDSGLTLELPDDYEMRSESSAAFVTSEGTERSVYPPLALGNSFSFKFQDRKGRVHRFSSTVESLEELFAAIMQRLVTGGAGDTQDRPLLLYEDDEGDRVLLQTDLDLVAAVDYSRSTGSKVLRLHLDYSSSTMNRVEQEEKEEEEEEEEVVVALGGSRMMQNVMDDESRWIFVGSGMVALCSIGLLVYLRRLNA